MYKVFLFCFVCLLAELRNTYLPDFQENLQKRVGRTHYIWERMELTVSLHEI